MGTFCGSPFFVRAGWPVLFFSLVGQTRQGAAAGGFVPHGCGERDAARCRGGPGPHRVGGQRRVPPSGGRCRAGLGFLWGELSSGVQHFFWRGKVETLSGSIVEHLHHFFHFLGRDLMEVGPSREELPYETIQVLNRRFLPG